MLRFRMQMPWSSAQEQPCEGTAAVVAARQSMETPLGGGIRGDGTRDGRQRRGASPHTLRRDRVHHQARLAALAARAEVGPRSLVASAAAHQKKLMGSLTNAEGLRFGVVSA